MQNHPKSEQHEQPTNDCLNKDPTTGIPIAFRGQIHEPPCRTPKCNAGYNQGDDTQLA